ncbi:proline oxidase PrnD [Talaromyces stipitatus ATCC 10500]|uniref:Proline dehydrogenase n=1 Tax=Talaromyces stipitatus (strain ATCC 10500 / CBS 375.48 / QM 6759 / NRRL 1006) TaxID=441959 RepID=B8M1R3_TALSN|nr:proline oxidase PrnD [Talaromyces stipitatus ATCC 10500]EED22150.1 proline oxidase PrnD [Talaromyces stipitatus ATCC 10500]
MSRTRALCAFSTAIPPPSPRVVISSLVHHSRHVSTTQNAKASAIGLGSTPEPTTTASILQSTFPSSTTHPPPPPSSTATSTIVPTPRPPTKSPLAKLPLSAIIRSALILSISSSPLLLKPCIWALSALASPKIALTDVDRNPILNWLVKTTIYKQFNAGENKDEVQRSIVETKALGCRGVLLGYAREVLVADSETSPHDETLARQEVDAWLKGTLQGVDMATAGDFVALKLTGMGTQAVHLLKNRLPPSEYMGAAITKACDAALAKSARLLVDAEEQAVQPGIEDWVMKYQKYCNSQSPGYATMYCTYQAYLKSTPATIAKHLAMAEKDGYTLGVKLVRGAYMKIESRNIIWDTKEETDACYDGVVEALLTRRYNFMLRPAPESQSRDQVPSVNMIIATHNRDSVLKAHQIRLRQAENNDPRVELAYAQLQGMADEISCELISGFSTSTEKTSFIEQPNVYKLLTWGSVQECMGFLYRRALENTEAVTRTKDSRSAMYAELWRRITRQA